MSTGTGGTAAGRMAWSLVGFIVVVLRRSVFIDFLEKNIGTNINYLNDGMPTRENLRLQSHPFAVVSLRIAWYHSDCPLGSTVV